MKKLVHMNTMQLKLSREKSKIMYNGMKPVPGEPAFQQAWQQRPEQQQSLQRQRQQPASWPVMYKYRTSVML
jgi:hypothetical protein